MIRWNDDRSRRPSFSLLLNLLETGSCLKMSLAVWDIPIETSSFIFIFKDSKVFFMLNIFEKRRELGYNIGDFLRGCFIPCVHLLTERVFVRIMRSNCPEVEPIDWLSLLRNVPCIESSSTWSIFVEAVHERSIIPGSDRGKTIIFRRRLAFFLGAIASECSVKI